jgi:hypothetical protein
MMMMMMATCAFCLSKYYPHYIYGSLRDQQQQHKENGKIEGGDGEKEGGTVRYIIDRNEENFRGGNEETKQKNMRLLLLLLLYYYYYSQLPQKVASGSCCRCYTHGRIYIVVVQTTGLYTHTQVRVVQLIRVGIYVHVYIDISLKLSLSVYPYLRLLFFNEDTSYIGRSI